MAEQGYDGVTMRRLGAEIGVRAGAIYRYFPDKQSLAADLLSEALSERDAMLSGIDRSQDPVEVLEAFVSAYVSWTIKSGSSADMIRLCLPALGSTGQALSDAALAPDRELEAILTRGQDSGDIRVPDTRVATTVVLSVLDAIASDRRLAEDRRERIAQSMVRRLVKA